MNETSLSEMVVNQHCTDRCLKEALLSLVLCHLSHFSDANFKPTMWACKVTLLHSVYIFP